MESQEIRESAASAQVAIWLPQNDVLGHPRTRAFLTHGGANSMYEVRMSECCMSLIPRHASVSASFCDFIHRCSEPGM